uniref:DDE_Tnp_IS1595 domain-containing protein n=1 Tax=Trichuris muris TaxID=70415 RepID=A0A5S6QH12_TRIMR
MVLKSRNDRRDVRWRCSGTRCYKELSPKTEPGCDLPIRTFLLFIQAWSEKLTSVAHCKALFNMNKSSVLKLNAAMRRIAEEWLLKNPVPVGGPGLTVEVDESLFSKRKYNRARVLPQAWVVGGVCRETGHCFLGRVADRSAATLIDVIKENVAAGSTTVESIWSHAKQGNKARRGTHRSKIDSYLCEFVWRRRLSRDEHLFNSILCAIAELYPPR